MKALPYSIFLIYLFALLLFSCQSPTTSYTPRASWYASWQCHKISGTIDPPSPAPTCIETFRCFNSDVDFNYCRREVEDYSDALNRWDSCAQDEILAQVKDIQNALMERIDCIYKTKNCSTRWEDDRIKGDYVSSLSQCSDGIVADDRFQLGCRFEKPKVPDCLEYISKSESFKNCQYEIDSYQEKLKSWLEKSIKVRRASIQDQVNYVIDEFNAKARGTGCSKGY